MQVRGVNCSPILQSLAEFPQRSFPENGGLGACCVSRMTLGSWKGAGDSCTRPSVPVRRIAC